MSEEKEKNLTENVDDLENTAGAEDTAPKKKRKSLSAEKTYLFITIPIVALFFLFNTLPLIQGVVYSFTNFKGYGDFDWVGMRNYADLFTDARVGKSYWFTFRLALVSTVVTNVISLVLALGLNSKIKFKI